MRVHLITLVAGLLLGGLTLSSPVQAQECQADCLKDCPTAKKVKALLGRWEKVGAEAKTVALDQKKAELEACSKLAARCPVGSRMNASIVSVRDTLAYVIASSKANAKDCPMHGPLGQLPQCAEIKAMKGARAQALEMLHQLASHTAAGTSFKSCGDCGSSCSAEKSVAMKSEGSKSSCESKCCASSCPIKLASRLGETKAILAQARREAEAMSVSDRRELLVGLATLAKTNKVVALVPSSAAALEEGFSGLEKLHGKMKAWSESNPEVFAKVPANLRQAFLVEAALLNEAHGVLKSLMSAMDTMKPSEAKTAMVR